VQDEPAAAGLHSDDDRRREKHHEGAWRLPQSQTETGSIVCHGPVDDPSGGWGLSIFSVNDRQEVERLTQADPIILDDIGASYEILPMKQLRIKGAG
jgi:uncharacterized protein YciI